MEQVTTHSPSVSKASSSSDDELSRGSCSSHLSESKSRNNVHVSNGSSSVTKTSSNSNDSENSRDSRSSTIRNRSQNSNDKGRSRSTSSSSSSSSERSRNSSRSGRSKSPNSDNERTLTRTKSTSSSSSDDEHLKDVNDLNKSKSDSDNERESLENNIQITKSSDDVPVLTKSSGKFSLITESDLESEDDRPNKISSDDSCSRSENKTKKLRKTKPKKSKSGPSNELASDSEHEGEPKKPRKSKKNSAKRTKADKDKDPMLTIRSETQRMIREGRISLPYHQPKQRTLHEFLQRRKTTPSIPLKPTADILKTVYEQLTIKEKEVEEFYKSESDNSDAETEPQNAESIQDPSNSESPTISRIDENTVTTLAENNQQPELMDTDQISEKPNELENQNITNTNTISKDLINVDVDAVQDQSCLPNQNTSDSQKSETRELTTKQLEISDSVDFELIIQDSCNEISNSQEPAEVTQPESNKSKANHLERTLALLSNHNIKLPPVKLNTSAEQIQFEILKLEEQPVGIWKLKEKFVKHSLAKNKPKKATSQINVISTQTDAGGEVTGITKETLLLNLENPEEEFSDPKFSKPGAKHAYLRGKIRESLILKKEASWNEYQNEKRKLYGTDSEDEKTEEEDQVTCKKLNFEPYHPEDEPDDDELNEDDVVIEEKQRDKNYFLDEEAEEADEPDEDSDTECDKNHDTSDSLFKYHTTGTDLENKLLGLESISQTNNEMDDITDSQVFGICSGKFVSQVAQVDHVDGEFFADSQDSQNITLSLADTEPSKPGEEVLPSDESDNEELFATKKKAMRIEDSDDDEGEEDKAVNLELSDVDEDEPVEDNFDDIEAEEFGYDSEEELVTYKKPTEFFENEAELSGSEWGSEDENENELDKLEKEEGDDDDIDTDKLKEELGKIHMRQLLDDDQHDVRLLKEMLLEDGELHSDAKRQRKFQWRNLDGDDFFIKNPADSDEENIDDDETEEHWRKIRHERETFLSQQEAKCISETENIEMLVELPSSTKILNETVTKIQIPSNTSGTQKASCEINQFKCGSFLSRGKFLLSKIALTVSECKENVNGAKNSRNFVFGARSPEKSGKVTSEKNEKRKFSSTSTNLSKRMKLSIEKVPKVSTREGLLAQLALTE